VRLVWPRPPRNGQVHAMGEGALRGESPFQCVIIPSIRRSRPVAGMGASDNRMLQPCSPPCTASHSACRVWPRPPCNGQVHAMGEGALRGESPFQCMVIPSIRRSRPVAGAEASDNRTPRPCSPPCTASHLACRAWPRPPCNGQVHAMGEGALRGESHSDAWLPPLSGVAGQLPGRKRAIIGRPGLVHHPARRATQPAECGLVHPATAKFTQWGKGRYGVKAPPMRGYPLYQA